MKSAKKIIIISIINNKKEIYKKTEKKLSGGAQSNNMDSGINSAGSETNDELSFDYRTIEVLPFKNFSVVNLKLIPKKTNDIQNPTGTHAQTFLVLPLAKEPTKRQNKARQNNNPRTNQRRMQANARERNRVHTISEAYENLRKAIPSYSSMQQLSKLTILRVAKAYISTLERLNNDVETESDQSAPPISSYFETLTNAIQSDVRLRYRKDLN